MKILYAMTGYKPAYRLGGPVISVSEVAERLVHRGHEVTVVATTVNLDRDLEVPVNTPVNVNGVSVWYFRREEPLKKYFPFIPYVSQSIGFLYAPELRKAIDGIVAAQDLVNTQMPFIYPTYVASRAALRHQKPLFYHQRGSFLQSHLRRRSLKKRIFIDLFEKPVLGRATTLIALNGEEKEAFRAISPTSHCEIVPNGVQIPSVADGFAERIQAAYGIPPTAAVVLFFGRLHEWKGTDILLEAFASVQASVPDAYLVMAGPDEGAVEQRWKPVAARSGFGSRLIFTGSVTGSNKDDLLARSDIFCLPSRGEGFSMAVLEALASGTPVMLSPECNFAEAERAGAGWVVSARPGAVADKLNEALADRGRLRQMGDAGRRLVTHKYSWDIVVDQLIGTYEEGLARWQKHHKELRTN